ncbi:MAG: hypothetical protein RMI83_00010 [Desulfurococcaceae archaeon]|nr:hypothetical protein [Sulfolobales archaeon]MDW8169485.1 hypothetical protein [Desulfurococcaceae archaeon]
MQVKRAQSEVVGGAIAISILFLTFMMLLGSVFNTTTSTSSALTTRSKFESERILELRSLGVLYRNEVCYLRNRGPLNVTIVRLWSRGSYESRIIDLSPGVDYNAGSVSTAPEYVVTSRGNVIPLREECERIKKQYEVPQAGSPFISDNVLSPRRVESVDACYIVTVDNVVYSILYNGSGGWKYWPSASRTCPQPISTSTSLNPDVDGNRVNELIVYDHNKRKAVEIVEKEGVVNITFLKLVAIPSGADVVNIYFKLVLSISGGNPHDVLINSEVILTPVSGGQQVRTTASSARGGSTDVLVIVGWATFPAGAFEKAFGGISSGGEYSLSIYININMRTGGITVSRISLEYLAVNGATLLWEPKPS